MQCHIGCSVGFLTVLVEFGSALRWPALEEIAPGIWHWTAFHERIRDRVSSYYVQPSRALIDPMLPEDVGLAWFADRGVDRILLTNRHHHRHSERFSAALDGCPVLCHEAGLHEFEGGPEVEGFAFGDEVANGVFAREVGVICPEETALHIQHGDGAMALADAVGNWPGSGLGFVPDGYLGDDPEGVKRGLVEALRNLLQYDFEVLALAHGDPVAPGGKAALARFVEA